MHSFAALCIGVNVTRAGSILSYNDRSLVAVHSRGDKSPIENVSFFKPLSFGILAVEVWSEDSKLVLDIGGHGFIVERIESHDKCRKIGRWRVKSSKRIKSFFPYIKVTMAIPERLVAFIALDA